MPQSQQGLTQFFRLVAGLAIVVFFLSSFGVAGFRLLHRAQTGQAQIQTAEQHVLEKVRLEGQHLTKAEELLNSLMPGDRFSITYTLRNESECSIFKSYKIVSDPYSAVPYLEITTVGPQGDEEVYFSAKTFDGAPLELLSVGCDHPLRLVSFPEGLTLFPQAHRLGELLLVRRMGRDSKGITAQFLRLGLSDKLLSSPFILSYNFIVYQ